MNLPNSVFCEIEGCKNTAHFRFHGVALCVYCIDYMASMNSDNEVMLRTALAGASPITECLWVCEACKDTWDSFHIRNGVCGDCRSTMPYAWKFY